MSDESKIMECKGYVIREIKNQRLGLIFRDKPYLTWDIYKVGRDRERLVAEFYDKKEALLIFEAFKKSRESK